MKKSTVKGYSLVLLMFCLTLGAYAQTDFEEIDGVTAAPQEIQDYDADDFVPNDFGSSLLAYHDEIALNVEERADVDHLVDRLDAEEIHIVELNTAGFDDERSMTINLPHDLSVTMDFLYRKERGGQRYSWFGSSPDYPGAASFVINKNTVTGSIRFYDHYYKIIPIANDKHVLVSLSEITATHDCGSHDHHVSTAREINPLKQQIDGMKNTPEYQEKAMMGECDIDLYVAYSDDVVADYTGNIEDHIQNLVDDYNLANDRSGVDFDVSLVRSDEWGYAETNSTVNIPGYGTRSEDLENLWNPSDGILDPIHDRRDLHDADMVILLLTQVRGSSGQIGGQALVISAVASEAFCVMVYDNGIPQTFAHEFGHLEGKRHDPFVDATTTPYAYGHGYTYTGSGTNFRTIMAYSNACSSAGTSCGVIDNWSNPSRTFGGNATGTSATHDNARVARVREVTVAGFQGGLSNKEIYENVTITDGETGKVYGSNTLDNERAGSYYNYTVNNGGYAELWADNSITMYPGFHARSGSVTELYLDNCTANAFDLPDHDEPDVSLRNANDDDQESMSSTDELSVHISPNPVRHEASFQYQLDKTYQDVYCELYNSTGQRVSMFSCDISAGLHQLIIPMGDKLPGAYTVVLWADGQRVATEKLIKI